MACIPSYRYATFAQLRKFHNYNSKSVVIVAATRTPWGKCKGQLATVTAWQLGQMAVEAAVKQSSIPLEQIERIFMNDNPQLQHENGFVFSNFLKKAKYIPFTGDGKLEFFLKSLNFLKSRHEAAVTVGGLAYATQNESKMECLEKASSSINVSSEEISAFMENYITQSMIRYNKSQSEGVFNSELVPLTVQQQEGNMRTMKELNRDEICDYKSRDASKSMQNCDGAVALVLTTMENAKNYKISPLAIVIGFEYVENTSDLLSSSCKCVEKLFSKVKLDPQQIQHWEIDDNFPQLVSFFLHHFKLNFDVINPNGGSLIFGCSQAVSLTRILTHITHSLNPLEYGCVICSSQQESLALIVRKLPWPSIPDQLPIVTLYTKDPCPLCDILVEELEHNFSGEYTLEKVYIDKKENVRFLRLYRFDIPVVFLNNQFLCMHRLNHKLLKRRLELIKKI